jgi:hypothetical protein
MGSSWGSASRRRARKEWPRISTLTGRDDLLLEEADATHERPAYLLAVHDVDGLGDLVVAEDGIQWLRGTGGARFDDPVLVVGWSCRASRRQCELRTAIVQHFINAGSRFATQRFTT